MRVMKLALVAVVAAATLVPTLSPEASARDFFKRMLPYNYSQTHAANVAANEAALNAAAVKEANARAATLAARAERKRLRKLNAHRYGRSGYAAAVANDAAVNTANANAVAATAAAETQRQAFVAEVNAQVAAGKISLFDGNAILVRGHW